MRKLVIVLLVLGWGNGLFANAQADSSGWSRKENLRWFEGAKFGIMLHLGLYTLLAGGGEAAPAEWIQRDKTIDPDAYAQLTSFFNPTRFDASKIVKQCKDAGARYLNFTVKHADGFALYDSQASGFNVMHTPYRQDILWEIAEACRAEDMGLFLHYYQMDLHHLDYLAVKNAPPAENQDSLRAAWNRYQDFQQAQLTELLSQYGPLRGLWLNGHWDLGDRVDWQLDETYARIRQQQPGVLIANNHHLGMLPGEDFYLYYKTFPNTVTTAYPQESFRSISTSWGYNLVDKNFLSAEEIIRSIVTAAGYNSNFMLNVALMPNGEMQPEVANILTKVGDWMRRYGETIYQTTSGPVSPQPWGVTTQLGDRIFVHVLDQEANEITLPGGLEAIRYAKGYPEGPVINSRSVGGDLVINLSSLSHRNTDTIIEIGIKE